jgi:hypothetical protein
MENMDKLIFVHQNWPSNSHISYLKPIDVAFACDLMVELEIEFENQVNNENYLDLHGFF